MPGCICTARIDNNDVEFEPTNGCVGYAATPQEHLEDLIQWTEEMDEEIRRSDY